MPAAFALVFFASGAAALVFETLWFHRLGLLLGNSIWSTSIVLSGFMAGLALGNGLAAALSRRVRRPERAYAVLEVVVGATGLLIVLLTPRVTTLLMPLLRRGLDAPLLLHGVRLATALALLLVPTTAMGATLPLLVRACGGDERSFGRTLGLLYGANTMGAVAGVLLGELVLVEALGIRGSAVVAAATNLAAAAGALALGRGGRPEPRSAPRRPLGRGALLLLVAGFLSGGAMLALEVVWFRLLLLYITGTSLAFAVVLAVVLAGIGAGGLLAGRLLRREPEVGDRAAVTALLTGASVVASYAALAWANRFFRDDPPSTVIPVLLLAAVLAAPAAIGSGALFTFLGARLRDFVEDEVRSTGLFTLANTVGAMLGSAIGGFLLLPRIGIEASLALLAAVYAVVGAASLPSRLSGRPRLLAAGAVFALSAVFFPYGLMERVHLRVPVERIARSYGSRLEAVREGLTETLIYMRAEAFGIPIWHQMVTNSFSMSGTSPYSARYMKLFVWLPVALRPAPKDALLVCFGVGMTAQALTGTRSLERIDVVDLSRDVLEMRKLVLPPATDPLRDPRVTVHVEDGRFFLEATSRRYDLITAEPPPPKTAGVGNLYSREFFELLRDRLRTGGVATYWLPVHNLTGKDTRALVGAFCGVFSDCSLWAGERADWILLGSRDGLSRPSTEGFTASFRDPEAAREMSRLGIERPEELGALFLADATGLAQLVSGTPPLTDDFPRRLSHAMPRGADPLYARLLEPVRARLAFARSAWVAAVWPDDLRRGALEDFATTAVFHRASEGVYLARTDLLLEDLHRVLTQTRYETAVAWMLGDPSAIAAAEAAATRGARGRVIDMDLGIASLARRDWLAAARRFDAAAAFPGDPLPTVLSAYALAKAGQVAAAADLLAPLGAADPGARWMRRTFRISSPESR